MQAHGHDQQSLYSFQASTLNANSYMVTTAEHGLAALASKLKEDKWDLVDPEASDAAAGAEILRTNTQQ